MRAFSCSVCPHSKSKRSKRMQHKWHPIDILGVWLLIRRRRLWSSKGASASVYALLACTALMQPYRKFVWLFGVELNSLG